MSPYKGYGQAPPGFIQLTGEAFMNPAAEVKFGEYFLDFSAYKMDFFHEFFGHELSHQWWGHALRWVSDEDQWLSESFAEYNAGLYVMALLGQERFQGKLKEWRDAARIGDPHSPIAWANNLSGENAGAWRFYLLYNKGPYILHMLRSQVGHEKFMAGLRGAIEKYRHKQVSTDELRREMETAVGYKLDYFFDQWFRGTGIPTFDYSTSTHQAQVGRHGEDQPA
jgi:aminopeptidase N